MRVALTFDDGPSVWTGPILDLLADHGAHATFFVVGSAIAGREATLSRITAEGHEVGNHTYSHPRLTDLDDDTVTAELEGGDAVLWRAPYFALDRRVDRIAKRLGLHHVSATVCPADWRWASDVTAAYVRANTKDGATVCLHDGIPPDGGTGIPTRAATVEAVRMILECSSADFATVSELH